MSKIILGDYDIEENHKREIMLVDGNFEIVNTIPDDSPSINVQVYSIDKTGSMEYIPVAVTFDYVDLVKDIKKLIDPIRKKEFKIHIKNLFIHNILELEEIYHKSNTKVVVESIISSEMEFMGYIINIAKNIEEEDPNLTSILEVDYNIDYDNNTLIRSVDQVLEVGILDLILLVEEEKKDYIINIDCIDKLLINKILEEMTNVINSFKNLSLHYNQRYNGLTISIFNKQSDKCEYLDLPILNTENIKFLWR